MGSAWNPPTLQVHWNVRPRPYQNGAWNPNDSLGRAAAAARRKFAYRFRRDVGANDGKIARFKLQNFRAGVPA